MAILSVVAILPVNAVFAFPPHQEGSAIEAALTKRAKLRVGPGTQWATIGYVEAGETVRIEGRASFTNLWVRVVTADGRYGWVFGNLIAAPPEQLSALPMVWDGTPISPQATPLPPQPSVDTPSASAPEAASLPNYDVISGISGHARDIYLKGQSLGNRPNVFSKVGDSITVSPYFLYPFGWGTYNLRGYGKLQAVVNYFAQADARDGNNSFSNPSLAAYNGITTGGILDPNNAWTQVCQLGETPLECEYRIIKPSVALIMLGTNDVVSTSLDSFRSNLGRIVQITVDRGTVPVLSLIPIRQGYENSIPAFNQVIADTAAANDIPLWNFGGALRGLDNNGLSSDGIHPSAPPGNGSDDYSAAADFTADNLHYGYTVRNLTAMQVLDAVWRRAMY
ncbi:MAG: GDSL-type esterase/lipase family protein [Chloroflexota bacterium]